MFADLLEAPQVRLIRENTEHRPKHYGSANYASRLHIQHCNIKAMVTSNTSGHAHVASCHTYFEDFLDVVFCAAAAFCSASISLTLDHMTLQRLHLQKHTCLLTSLMYKQTMLKMRHKFSQTCCNMAHSMHSWTALCSKACRTAIMVCMSVALPDQYPKQHGQE